MYIDDAVKNTELFEGRVNHMYLDNKGNVTVAVGLMLATLAAAQDLPFLKRGMGQDFPATPEEIAEDFNRIRAASVGHAAAYYHQNGVSLYLKDEDMDKQLRFFLAREDGTLRKHFAKYDQWPDAAKLAFLDMGYNLGPIRLFGEYPRMNTAAASDPPQWLTCAAECGRELGDPAFERRNTWTRAQFRGAWAER
jgi:hypothetical protein